MSKLFFVRYEKQNKKICEDENTSIYFIRTKNLFNHNINRSDKDNINRSDKEKSVGYI